MVANRDIQLHYAAEHLQEIINYTPGGMHICHLSAPIHLEYVSDGLCRLLGYERNEYNAIAKENYALHLPPEDRQIFMDFARGLAAAPGIRTVEYRMVKKDGTVITVSDTMESKIDADGIMRGYSSVTDITELKATQEELLRQREEYKKLYHEVKVSQERIHLVSSASGIMFFEYDLDKQQFVSFENAGHVLGCAPSDIQQRLNEAPLAATGQPPFCRLDAMLHPADIAVWDTADTEYDADNDFYAEVRLGCPDYGYHWFAVKKRLLLNEESTPMAEVGCIWSIEKSRQELSQLKQKAETDAMTGLYNKPSAYALIDSYLAGAPDQPHALLFFDMDDFKQINDRFGHDKGDEAIHYVAHMLRMTFRAEDVLARYGGDEFLAFLPHITNREAILEKAHQLHESTQSFEEFHGNGITLSVSIGAVFSSGEWTAKELCAKADDALYQAKAQGKGRTVVFGAEKSI